MCWYGFLSFSSVSLLCSYFVFLKYASDIRNSHYKSSHSNIPEELRTNRVPAAGSWFRCSCDDECFGGSVSGSWGFLPLCQLSQNSPSMCGISSSRACCFSYTAVTARDWNLSAAWSLQDLKCLEARMTFVVWVCAFLQHPWVPQETWLQCSAKKLLF